MPRASSTDWPRPRRLPNQTENAPNSSIEQQAVDFAVPEVHGFALALLEPVRQCSFLRSTRRRRCPETDITIPGKMRYLEARAALVPGWRQVELSRMNRCGRPGSSAFCSLGCLRVVSRTLRWKPYREVSETLDAIGRRLSQSLSESRLTAAGLARIRAACLPQSIGARRPGPWLPAVSCRGDPVVVEVAAPESSVPVLDSRPGICRHRGDAGRIATLAGAFSARHSPRVDRPGGQWSRSKPTGSLRGFPPCAIRTGPRHSLKMRSRWTQSRETMAQAHGTGRVSVRRKRSTGPSRACLPRLTGAVLLQPFHDRRHSTDAGHGTGLEDESALGGGSRPGHDRLRFRSRPRAGVELANRSRPSSARPSGSCRPASRRPRTMARWIPT